MTEITRERQPPYGETNRQKDESHESHRAACVGAGREVCSHRVTSYAESSKNTKRRTLVESFCTEQSENKEGKSFLKSDDSSTEQLHQ